MTNIDITSVDVDSKDSLASPSSPAPSIPSPVVSNNALPFTGTGNNASLGNINNGSSSPPPNNTTASPKLQPAPLTSSSALNVTGSSSFINNNNNNGGVTNTSSAPRQQVLTSYVGIDTIPSQIEKKLLKRQGFTFNLMVVGRSGLGKSTLVNTIFASHIKDSVDISSRSTVSVQTTSHGMYFRYVFSK